MKRFSFFGFLIGTLFFISVLNIAYAEFAPGETLDPGCSPTLSTCTVTRISVATSTGNFGIGTTSPISIFTISATSSLSNLSPFSVFVEPSAGATTTALSILSNGNVGIGTTTPGTIFGVMGRGVFADYVNASTFVATSTTATSTFAGGLSVNALSITSTTATSTIAGGLSITGGGLRIASLLGCNTGSTLDTDGNGYVVCGVDTGGVGSQTPWTSAIDAGGYSLTNGGSFTFTNFTATSTTAISSIASYLGIGTTSPTSLLTISATSSLSNRPLLSIFAEATSGATTTALTISSSGNVGLGTTTPGTILSVGGVGNFASVMSTIYSALSAPYFISTSSVASVFPYASTTAITVSGATYLTGLSTGGVAVNSSGLLYSFATSTWSFASSTLLADSNIFSGLNQFNNSGTTTFSGGLYGSLISAPYFHATSTTATSTFAGLLDVSRNGVFGGFLSASTFNATSTTATSTFAWGVQANALNITSTSATSTFARGIDLAGGCFAINGVCVGEAGGGGSGTVNAATAIGQVPYYAAASNAITATSTLFISTASNVGIGTTTPEGKLEVAGNIFFSAYNSGFRRLQIGTSTIDSSNITGSALEILAGGANAVTSGSGIGGAITLRGGIGLGDTGSVGGAINIKGGSGYTGGALTINGGDSNVGGSATFRAGDAIDGGTVGGQLILRAGNETASNGGKITLNAGSGGSGGSVTILGGVGEGGGPIVITSGAGATTGGSSVQINAGNGSSGDGGSVNIYAGNGSAGSVGGNVSLYGGTGDTSGNVILANVSGTPRGLVGVGIASPTAQLSVHAPGGTPSFAVGSSTTTFIISDNRNVGIGTSSPYARLSVTGSVAMPALATAAGNAYVCIDAGGTVSTSTSCTASTARLKDDVQSFDSARGISQVMAMRPVTFTYKPEVRLYGAQVGFIAEEMASVVPEVVGYDAQGLPAFIDYAKLVPVLTKAIQDQEIKIQRLEASAFTSSGGVSFSSVLASLESLGTKIVDGIVYVKNLIADQITTKKLCLDDVCITKAELKDLLDKNAIDAQSSFVSNSSSSTSNSSTTADSSLSTFDSNTDTTPPVITLNGSNPATIEKGSSYVDLGATVVDPAWGTEPANTNLGVQVTGNQIDTSIVGEYIVTYTASDQAGNTATSTRNVIVTGAQDSAEQTPIDANGETATSSTTPVTQL